MVSKHLWKDAPRHVSSGKWELKRRGPPHTHQKGHMWTSNTKRRQGRGVTGAPTAGETQSGTATLEKTATTAVFLPGGSMDRGARQAEDHGFAKSRTCLKWLGTNAEPLWKTVFQSTTKLNAILSDNPAIPLLDIHPKEWNTISTQGLHVDVDGGFIHNWC